MKARYPVMASLAIVLLSGCANEEKPVAPSDSTTSSVESTVESGESSHIEETPSSNSGVSSVESTGAGDSGESSEVTSTPVQSIPTENPTESSVSPFAFGTVIHINGESFDSKWSFGEAKSNGWEYQTSTTVVKSKEVGSVQILLTKGDKKVYVTVFNATDTDKIATDCEIIGAVCSNEGAEIGNDDAFIDFKVGADLKLAYAVMGPVTKINSYRGYESFTVPTDEGTLYYFTYDDSSKLTSVGITHGASNGQTFIE